MLGCNGCRGDAWRGFQGNCCPFRSVVGQIGERSRLVCLSNEYNARCKRGKHREGLQFVARDKNRRCSITCASTTGMFHDMFVCVGPDLEGIQGTKNETLARNES